MKKSKLSLQFMSELLIVSIFGLIIGAGIGSFVSVPVSNKLLANEIENANAKYDDIGKNFGRRDIDRPPTENNLNEENNNDNKNFRDLDFGIAKVNEVDSIDAVVDFKVLYELLEIGVLLTLVSSLASMIAIARFSPLQILKERS